MFVRSMHAGCFLFSLLYRISDSAYTAADPVFHVWISGLFPGHVSCSFEQCYYECSKNANAGPNNMCAFFLSFLAIQFLLNFKKSVSSSDSSDSSLLASTSSSQRAAAGGGRFTSPIAVNEAPNVTLAKIFAHKPGHKGSTLMPDAFTSLLISPSMRSPCCCTE